MALIMVVVPIALIGTGNNQIHIDDFVNEVEALLEESGCDELVALEIEHADSPFYRPSLPIKVESEESCKRNRYYRYARKLESFDEKIRVRVINLPNEKEIRGLFVSGTLYEYMLFSVVLDVVMMIRTLTVLRLVDCSLTAEGIQILGRELGKTSVTHLYLDRNPVKHQNYYYILHNNQMLKHLSLVQCHIDVKGAKLLGRQLGPSRGDEPTHCLKSLNLNNNRLDCYAAKFIAQGLKWNKDIIFLTLAGNIIGDTGMEFLSSALTLVPLEKWEKEFRKERFLRRRENITAMVNVGFETFKNELQEECGREGYESNDSEYCRQYHFQSLIQEYLENDTDPMNCNVVELDGKLMSKGNKTLKNLDLSYNKIGEQGYKYLLNALRYQLKERRTMSDEERERYHLKWIKTVGNFCLEHIPVVRKIYSSLKLMNMREDQNANEWPEGAEEEEERFSEVESEESQERSEDLPDVAEKKTEPSADIPIKTRAGKARAQKEQAKVEPDESVPPEFQDLLVFPSESDSTDPELESSGTINEGESIPTDIISSLMEYI